MRILIADDDPTSRELSRQIIAHAGHQVDAVADGPAALAALLTGRYALALLDVQMPGMDGHEVARAARSAVPAVATRLVAFSAGLDPGAEAACRALGFDGCLAKPIRPSALVAALGLAAGAAARPAPAAPRPRPPALAAAPARAVLADAAACPVALAAAARQLKGAAVAAEEPLLAGLCARLERAALSGDLAAAAELAGSIVALLPL